MPLQLIAYTNLQGHAVDRTLSQSDIIEVSALCLHLSLTVELQCSVAHKKSNSGGFNSTRRFRGVSQSHLSRTGLLGLTAPGITNRDEAYAFELRGFMSDN